jgi:hypothetical protein
VIEALQAPRKGWFDGYQAETDSDVFEPLPIDEDSEEWEW